MTNSTNEFFLDSPWESIKEPCYPKGRRLYLNDERFWVAIDENWHRLFFVQTSGGESIKALENLAGLSVEIEECPNGEFRLVCRLTVHDPELLEKFGTVAKDIAFSCSPFKNTQLFLRVQERIKSWANFLRPSRGGLTRSEFVGLLGELFVLSEHLLPALSPDDAIKAWIGADDKKQDFALDSWAIEVKTSLSGDQQVITISSLEQLERITEKLYLLRVVASPAADGSGVSLESLYEKTLEAVEHDVLLEGEFIRKAAQLYGRASESQLADRFKIIDVSTFDVTDEFPYIKRSDVQSAVVNARYDLAVSALAPFKVDLEPQDIFHDG
jgi:hypothetical protein